MGNDALSLSIFKGFSDMSQKFDEQAKRMDKQDEHLVVIEHKLNALEKLFKEVTQDYFQKVIEDVGSIVRTFQKMDFTNIDDIGVAKRNLEVLDHSAKMLSKDSITQAKSTENGVNFSEMYTEMIEPIIRNIGEITQKLEGIEGQIDKSFKLSQANNQSIVKNGSYGQRITKNIFDSEERAKNDTRHLSGQIDQIKYEILESITGMQTSARYSAGALRDEMGKQTDRARVSRHGSMSTR